MKTHEQLMSVATFVDSVGTVWACPQAAVADTKPGALPIGLEMVMSSDATQNGYQHCAAAAVVLYQTAFHAQQTLEMLVDILEEHSADVLVDPIMSLVTALNAGREIAISGLAHYATRQVQKPG